MPTLSGNQSGTSSNDTFFGNVALTANDSASSNAKGFGFDNATVLAREGDDTISGIAEISVGPDLIGTAEAVGFDNTTVFAGTGNDTVIATGDARDLQGSGEASGFGFRDSIAFGDDGDDTFTIKGFSQSNKTAGGAFTRSFINAGNGDDVMTLSYEGAETPGTERLTGLRSATGSGADGAGIRAGDGADTINISAAIELEGFSFVTSALTENNPIVFGAKDTLEINGGNDNDVLNTSAVASGDTATSSGLDNSRMLGGEGNDTLTVSSKATGVSGATTIALDNSSRVSGNSGDDKITILSEGNSGGIRSGATTAYGIKDSSLSGGGGSDVVEITVTGNSVDRGTGIGVENSGIDLADGDDTLTIDAFGFGNSGGVGVGIAGTTILGGGGNDTIDIKGRASGEDSVQGDATGAEDSRIYAGNGDDRITIRSSFGFGNVDIDDLLLAGGSGNDSFDVGVGNARFKGDGGTDTAILDFLGGSIPDSIELSVTESRGNVQITSNLDNTGFGTASSTWTQSFRSVEVFHVSGINYSASELVATFG